MASRIITKKGSGAPLASDLVHGELAVDTVNKRLYTENAGGTVIEVGTSPSTIDINAGTIDGTVIGGSTAAAITGTTITGTSFVSSGDMTFGDNDKAVFGAGSDLQIYHTGSQNYIEDAGTGNLNFKSNGNNFNFLDGSDNVVMQIDIDSDTTLYHNTSAKLATTATGIDVTGTVTADGLTVTKAAGDIATLEGTGTTADVQANLVFNPVFDVNARIVSAREGASLASTLSFETGVDNTGSTVKRQLIASNGDIAFYEDTGTTAKFFWDASAESLGIGTVSPSRQLSIYGTDDGYMSFNGGRAGNHEFVVGTDSVGFVIYDETLDTYRLVIDQDSGNVGIGASDPAGWRLRLNKNDAQHLILLNTTGNGTRINMSDQTWQAEIEQNAGSLLFKTGGTTERVRIDASGNLLVGRTSTSGLGKLNVEGGADFTGGDVYLCRDSGNLLVGTTTTGFVNANSWAKEGSSVVQCQSTSVSTGGTYIYFVYGGSQIGSITQSITSVSYNTTSDQRLKENITDANDAGDKIDAIKIRQYDWKADGSHQDYGMVAQELMTVAPEAVHQPEDPEQMMGVDYSKLVPMLIKEIQSLRARVAQLEGAN